tara:strand:- start:4456 stop:5034 length:579 start_codon:yes stop_codon:yes gene_type:complete
VRTSKKLRKRIIDQAIKDLVKGGLTSLTMPLLAKEVKVTDEEIAEYFTSREEVLVAQQERLWKSQFSKTDKLIKKAKTPADYKEIFEAFFDNLVESLDENVHIQFEVFSFVPACLQYRAKAKIRLKKYFLKLIKKGWPGKTPEVLDRQTDLILLTFYGFLDHIVHISVSERKKILKDYKNMLNLHLQDRLFF